MPSPLFRPFQISNLHLNNRIVMAPMTRNFSPGGIPGENVARYYEKRAEGGVGLIITEGTTIDHKASNGYPDVPRFYGEDALAGWQKVVDAVHAVHGKIFPQLWHVGSVRQTGSEPDPSVPGYSASAVPHPYKKDTQTPHVMTQNDIADIIAAFAKAAGEARRIGFDGIELHGAHGYLIDQFFWDQTNQRTDAYGGSLENRSRFATEIIKAVRDAVGKDFPIMLRFSQWKMGAFGARLAQTTGDLEIMLAPLVQAGVDIFHCSTRRFYQPEFEGSDLNLAGWTKKITGLPTCTVGSVGLKGEFTRAFLGRSATAEPIDELVKRAASDEFDLIAVGRALISDPEWPNKVKENRLDEIKGFNAEDLKHLD